jgi:hypothetical protein
MRSKVPVVRFSRLGVRGTRTRTENWQPFVTALRMVVCVTCDKVEVMYGRRVDYGKE